MAFNLATFRKTVHSIGRTQYFIIDIPPVSTNYETLSALARSAQIPQLNHETGDVFYRGLAMKLDMRPTYDPWTVKFLCDEPSTLRNILCKWMEKAYSVSTLQNQPHNLYKQDNISITQLSLEGKPMNRYVFMGAFPSTVGSIEMSQEAASVMEFEVTFTYDYFLQSTTTTITTPTVDIDVSESDGKANGANITIAGLAGIKLTLS